MNRTMKKGRKCLAGNFWYLYLLPNTIVFSEYSKNEKLIFTENSVSSPTAKTQKVRLPTTVVKISENI